MKNPAVEIRDAEEGEIGRLARLWYDSWQDAHAEIVPVELPRLRTVEKLEERLAAMLPSVRVGDLSGEPAGLCAIKGLARVRRREGLLTLSRGARMSVAFMIGAPFDRFARE
jgi:hypothetical protein